MAKAVRIASGQPSFLQEIGEAKPIFFLTYVERQGTMSEENTLEVTRDAATRSEDGCLRTRCPQPLIPPPVESINVLARALSVPLEGALTASMEGFWSRLDVRLDSLAP